mgnify:CR=1 FL=1
MLNRLLTLANPLGNQPSSQAIITDLVAHENVEFMLVAKAHGYDTCPIGGFKHEELADVVGIDKKRYKALHIISIGKADEEGYESVRLKVSDVATFL